MLTKPQVSMTFLLASICLLAWTPFSFAQQQQIDPDYAINITLYHINQANYSIWDVTNMNSADLAGDLYFSLRSRMLPYECERDPTTHDCYNPEVNSTIPLAITKLLVEIDARFTNYSRCNVDNGVYSCSCPPGKTCTDAVGMTGVRDFFVFPPSRQPTKASEDWQWWRYNVAVKMGGTWYSTPGAGHCNETKTSEIAEQRQEGPPCYWRVVQPIKRIAKNCSDQYVDDIVLNAGDHCFQGCPQPTNSSSDCYVRCYYETLLGPGASNSQVDPYAGVDTATLARAFENGFISDDPMKGGCPPM